MYATIIGTVRHPVDLFVLFYPNESADYAQSVDSICDSLDTIVREIVKIGVSMTIWQRIVNYILYSNN